MENVLQDTGTIATSNLGKEGWSAPLHGLVHPDGFRPQEGLGASRYRYTFPGGRHLDALLVNEGSDVLIVTFHGALNRERDHLPRFERLGSTSTFGQSMLFFSDPGLFADDSLELAWFTGWPGVDLQPVIAAWATKVAQVVGASRIIFTGSSGGGFAALQVSALVPGSVCLAFNPQTSIHAYLVSGHGVWAQRKYIEVFHPELVTDGKVSVDFSQDWTLPFGDHLAPTRRYSSPTQNYVLYADNLNDFHHEQHYLPLCSAVAAGGNSQRFRTHEYQGPTGHAPPTPAEFSEAMAEALEWCREIQPPTPLAVIQQTPKPDPVTREDFTALKDEIDKLRTALAMKVDRGPFLGERCEISSSASVAEGCVLRTGAYSPIRIGDHTHVWRGAQWLGPITVGNRVFVNQSSYIRPNVTIEDDVSIGPFVRIVSDTHDISAGQRRTGTPRKDPIVIGAGTWIGACATIMGGVTVGKRSIIAAGALVTKDIPDNVVAAGVPARVIRLIEDGEQGAELIKIADPAPGTTESAAG